MHDAVAATEVVCDTSRNHVANAMHCQTTRLQAPSGMWINRPVVLLGCLCWKPTRRNESDEFGNSEQSVSRFSAFGWRSGFFLSSAKLLVKVSIGILSAFCLLPRLEEVCIHRVHTKPQPPRSAEKWFTNSQSAPTRWRWVCPPPSRLRETLTRDVMDVEITFRHRVM